MFRFQIGAYVCLVAMVVSLAGCGGTGEPADRPARAPVTATVTYNGPVAGATVTFFAKDTKGKGAFGLTDANGKATLTTFTDTVGDGAIPGDYTVTVTKTEGGGQPEGDEESDYEESDDAPEAKNVLPAKYADKTSSPLSATVPAEGKDFQFTLED